jgi:LruC domain-containing protein
MKKQILSLAALALILASCNKEDQTEVAAIAQTSQELTEVKFPANFNFSTAREVRAQVSVMSIKDRPLAGTRVSFYKGDPDQGAALIGVGVTNSGGQIDMPLNVPAYTQEVYVVAHTAGFANKQKVSVNNINVNFGGKPGLRDFGFGKAAGTQSITPISGNYYYMGSFTSGTNAGFPSYLENPGDVITQDFLDDVNASLPENSPVPTNNPSYLTVGNELDVVIDDQSDVWVTFITEGAGYRNALGYYVFDTDNPPATVNDIDSIFVVLPNASLDGAGGKLQAGDKVKLGTFDGGQTISWVLFQNAWTGTGVNVNATKYYSRIDFNTSESDPTKRQHTVQLADIGRQLLLNGFEDQTRSVNSDNDFNDLVFYVTANPWENVNIGGIPPVTPENDCDNDGVSDESDDFPCDPSRAVRNTYTGTLAYEDLWPSQGDYDFNDMVVDYEIDHILNGANQLVEIEADWTVRAIGAGYENGFGYAFDGLSPSVISSVNGHNLSKNIISNANNGVEAGQTDATIIAFDNVFDVMPNPGTKFVNTVTGETTVAPVTVSQLIAFTTPQVQANVGLPPYNPFIFVNGDRGREVHLADKLPTDLVDNAFFGLHGDATDLNAGYTYKTENGLPWAINISESFDYPIEYTPINEAYLNFTNWAVSGGSSNTDWFTNAIGNRNAVKIY